MGYNGYMKRLVQVAAAVLACEAVGLIGSIFTAPAVVRWYPALEKPFFNPPAWVFAPTWTLLYAMMGVALYMIWRKKEQGYNVSLALTLFFTQLFLNGMWSFLFFGLKSLELAVLDILMLWVLIILTVVQFWGIDRRASLLMIPYLAWVSYASILAYAIWRLNS